MNNGASSEEQDSEGSKESFGGPYSAFVIEGGKSIELHGCTRTRAEQFVREHPSARMRGNGRWQ